MHITKYSKKQTNGIQNIVLKSLSSTLPLSALIKNTSNKVNNTTSMKKMHIKIYSKNN